MSENPSRAPGDPTKAEKMVPKRQGCMYRVVGRGRVELEGTGLHVSSSGKGQGCMYRIVGRDKVAWAEASIELEGVDRVGRDRVACIEQLVGTGLHVSSSRWKGQGCMYRVGGRGRVACIELEGTGLHVSSSRWQGRDKVACIE